MQIYKEIPNFYENHVKFIYVCNLIKMQGNKTLKKN